MICRRKKLDTEFDSGLGHCGNWEVMERIFESSVCDHSLDKMGMTPVGVHGFSHRLWMGDLSQV